MKKTLKKSLSLILAILLTFSVATVSFAVEGGLTDANVPIHEDEAKIKALEYLNAKNGHYYQTITTKYYSDDEVSGKEVYVVTTTLQLEDGTAMEYKAYIDKYDATVYNKTAEYIFPIATILTPLTADEAFDYTLKALCANKEDVVVLKTTEIKENGKTVGYSYEFVENFYTKHKATIDVNSGFIDNIVIVEPVNIIDRIILMIKVLFARLLGGSIL